MGRERDAKALAALVLPAPAGARPEPMIEAERLVTEGFGATRPRESNDTLAGRARNRRVELARK